MEGSVEKYVDYATVARLRDGADGESSYSAILSNEAQLIITDGDYYPVAAGDYSCVVTLYHGTTALSPIGSGTPSSSQFTVTASCPETSITLDTSTIPGTVKWTCNTSIAISPSFAITLTISTGGLSTPITKVISLSASGAASGANVKFLQIMTPNGNVFNEDVTSVALNGLFMDGNTDITAETSVTYQWAKYVSGAYQDITGATSSSLLLASTDIDSYGSFRLTATYDQVPYQAYVSVFDKTDPIQVTVLSTIGSQIINRDGIGALYVKVTKLGEEIDPLKSERFLTEPPATAQAGDYYYKINQTNRSVTLMKYTSTWEEAPASEAAWEGTYTWTWRDKDGNVITRIQGYALPASGKVVYIDGAVVDRKLVADVEVVI